MKIYSKISSDGFKSLQGYSCDNCKTSRFSEDLPSNWIEAHREHFCPDCQIECKSCHTLFSINYSDTFFINNLCENCQERHHNE